MPQGASKKSRVGAAQRSWVVLLSIIIFLPTIESEILWRMANTQKPVRDELICVYAAFTFSPYDGFVLREKGNWILLSLYFFESLARISWSSCIIGSWGNSFLVDCLMFTFHITLEELSRGHDVYSWIIRESINCINFWYDLEIGHVFKVPTNQRIKVMHGGCSN